MNDRGWLVGGRSCVEGRRLRATSARVTDLPPVNIAVSELVPDQSAALCGSLLITAALHVTLAKH